VIRDIGDKSDKGSMADNWKISRKNPPGCIKMKFTAKSPIQMNSTFEGIIFGWNVLNIAKLRRS
jgi:hypothetical protein